jgi:hypothetical protein
MHKRKDNPNGQAAFLFPARLHPSHRGFIAENPGLNLSQISARTSLFRREIIDSLANLLADRTIERRGDAYYLRQKQRRPHSWRQRVAAWLLAA